MARKKSWLLLVQPLVAAVGAFIILGVCVYSLRPAPSLPAPTAAAAAPASPAAQAGWTEEDQLDKPALAKTTKQREFELLEREQHQQDQLLADQYPEFAEKESVRDAAAAEWGPESCEDEDHWCEAQNDCISASKTCTLRIINLKLMISPPLVISISLRPDLSPQAAEWLSRLVADSSKSVSQFYRAEPAFLLQGELASTIPQMTPSKGACPPGVDQAAYRKGRPCFAHDPDCGCHGPIMKKGMVGWAGGAGSGPHFFIYAGTQPATHWSHDHTVWGEVVDDESFAAIDTVLGLPKTNDGGMTMLKQKIQFNLESGA